jgi:hypothetical protein
MDQGVEVLDGPVQTLAPFLGQPTDRLQLQAKTEQGLDQLGQQPARQLAALLTLQRRPRRRPAAGIEHCRPGQDR